MFVRSPAFENGDQIPSEYGCHGSDVSIPLIFENVPEGTRSLALIMDDPDAPAGIFVHWVAYNIPSDLQGLPENIPGAPLLANGIRQGINDFGTTGYGGPCPPDRPHRYFIKLYALDVPLELDPGLSKEHLLGVMGGHVIEEAELMGIYAR